MQHVGAPSARTSIQRQARQWLIRMDGDQRLIDAERKALKEWMGRSALHRRELVRLVRFWNQANRLTELVGCFGPRDDRGGGRR